MKLTKLITLIAASFISLAAFAADGKVLVSTSSGDVKAENKGEVTVIAESDLISIGSTITTDAKSSVRLVLTNGTIILVGPNSSVRIDSIVHSGDAPANFEGLTSEPSGSTSTTSVTVLSGSVAVQANLNEGSNLSVKTGAGAVNTRQGDFVVSVSGASTTVETVSGTTSATAEGGVATTVKSGEKATFRKGSDVVTTAPMTNAETSKATQQITGTSSSEGTGTTNDIPSPSDISGDNPTHVETNSPSNVL